MENVFGFASGVSQVKLDDEVDPGPEPETPPVVSPAPQNIDKDNSDEKVLLFQRYAANDWLLTVEKILCRNFGFSYIKKDVAKNRFHIIFSRWQSGKQIKIEVIACKPRQVLYQPSYGSVIQIQDRTPNETLMRLRAINDYLDRERLSMMHTNDYSGYLSLQFPGFRNDSASKMECREISFYGCSSIFVSQLSE